MVKHCLAALAVSTALAAGAAWAQRQAEQPGAKSSRFITAQANNQWRASKLVGLNVYGPNDEKIGDISEVLLDRNGNVHVVVLGVGGFLGIGAKDVALPFSALKWVSHEEYQTKARTDRPPATGTAPDTRNTDAYQGYPHHAVVSMTKDELKNAPEFRYASQTETRPAPQR